MSLIRETRSKVKGPYVRSWKSSTPIVPSSLNIRFLNSKSKWHKVLIWSKNLIDIDNVVEKNIKLLAEAKNKKISDIQACVLKRPRHDYIVDVMNKLGVTINYITDGDIAGVLSVIGEKPKNDIYYSTGGGPEGVLAASALSCFGGQIQGRLVLNEEEKIRAKKQIIATVAI